MKIKKKSSKIEDGLLKHRVLTEVPGLESQVPEELTLEPVIADLIPQTFWDEEKFAKISVKNPRRPYLRNKNQPRSLLSLTKTSN